MLFSKTKKGLVTNMKISTKGRYAIKLMLDLALYSKGQPVKIKEIAKRQGISEKYLEQIVATLNKAALVKSIRGSHGGYMLSEPPRNYTVGRILRTMEGNLSPTDCVGANGWPCENKATCVSLIIWQKLGDQWCVRGHDSGRFGGMAAKSMDGSICDLAAKSMDGSICDLAAKSMDRSICDLEDQIINNNKS